MLLGTDLFARFLMGQHLAQGVFLIVPEPASVLDPVVQPRQYQQAQHQHRRQALDEHPLPTPQPDSILYMLENPSRQRPANHSGHRHGNGEQCGDSSPALGREPAVEVDQYTRE